MTDNIMNLPNQHKGMEDEEYLTALDRLADTTQARRDELLNLYNSGIFPDDLKDYARFLIHDSSGAVSNLQYYVEKGLTESTTWRAMYRCLEWIQHIDVLTELVNYRLNDPELPTEAS